MFVSGLTVSISSRVVFSNHVSADRLMISPNLLCSWKNLVFWKQETVAALVPQLHSIGVFDAKLAKGPVKGSTRSNVKQTGNAVCFIYRSMDCSQLSISLKQMVGRLNTLEFLTEKLDLI